MTNQGDGLLEWVEARLLSNFWNRFFFYDTTINPFPPNAGLVVFFLRE